MKSDKFGILVTIHKQASKYGHGRYNEKISRSDLKDGTKWVTELECHLHWCDFTSFYFHRSILTSKSDWWSKDSRFFSLWASSTTSVCHENCRRNDSSFKQIYNQHRIQMLDTKSLKHIYWNLNSSSHSLPNKHKITNFVIMIT